MRRILFSLIILLGFWNSVSAASFPFTDVQTTDSYYAGVSMLYDYGIITNNGDNLFRPNDPISRDTFVGLATSVSCKKCLIPSTEDIIAYQNSPFIDLQKTNPNYYCIAYAHEKNIVQGYLPGTDGKASCENGETYTSNPFCSNNNTSRIEAAAMLLRQAGLWDDIKNTSTNRSMNLTDVSDYWYGYAEKGIQANILSIKDGDKIYPDEVITRGEFADMASKILEYNQCSIVDNDISTASDMIVLDKSGTIIKKTVFPLKTSDSLGVISTTQDAGKIWTLTNPLTSEVLKGSGETYPLIDVGLGKWIAEVQLIDKASGKVISTSTSTITIEGGEEKKNPPLSVNIDASPISTAIGGVIDFGSVVTGGRGDLDYSWNFGDSSTSNTAGSTSHTYGERGVYTVVLTVTDRDGNTSQSTLVVTIDGDIDTDKDGIIDNDDLCPYVFGPIENKGCPKINTTNYTDIVEDLLGGIGANNGVTNDSLLGGIKKNSCLLGYQSSKGLVIGSPVCDTCPCQGKVEILASLRPCDLVFPTILSRDKKNIYIRGGFYLIP